MGRRLNIEEQKLLKNFDVFDERKYKWNPTKCQMQSTPIKYDAQLVFSSRVMYWKDEALQVWLKFLFNSCELLSIFGARPSDLIDWDLHQARWTPLRCNFTAGKLVLNFYAVHWIALCSIQSHWISLYCKNASHRVVFWCQEWLLWLPYMVARI